MPNTKRDFKNPTDLIGIKNPQNQRQIHTAGVTRNASTPTVGAISFISPGYRAGLKI